MCQRCTVSMMVVGSGFLGVGAGGSRGHEREHEHELGALKGMRRDRECRETDEMRGEESKRGGVYR